MDHTEDIIYEVVSALAAVDNVEPTNLDYDFADYINPIALGNLYATEGEFWECTFEVPKHEVTVTHTGDVYIDGSRRTQIGAETAGREDVHTHVQDTLRYRQSMLTQVPCMLYRCKNQPSRTMEYVNEGCEDVTGYDPNALLIGGVSFGADIIYAADRDRVRGSVTDAIQNDEEFSVSYRIETADNEVKQVCDRGVGLSGEDGVSSLVGYLTEQSTETSCLPTNSVTADYVK